LQRSGIVLIKYWFSVSQEEQEQRFLDRIQDPTKRWKISEMDMEARKKWHDYSQAKDTMFMHTDTEASPWYVVESDLKRNARINCISHLLSTFDYTEVKMKDLHLPTVDQMEEAKARTPYDQQRLVPDVARSLMDRSND
jgi:polyphosphate kinase 2 (PPK2 family)